MAAAWYYLIMRLLTLKPPWAYMLAHCGKNVENRSWYTPYRGPLLIHSSQSCSRRYYTEAVEWLASRGLPSLPPYEDLACGAVVATAYLSSVVTRLGSSWYEPGSYGWVLIDIQALARPVPCRGALKLTRPDADVISAVGMAG